MNIPQNIISRDSYIARIEPFINTSLIKVFFTRGLNFADMMTLEWNDIVDDRMYYVRSKTKSKFQIKIIPPAQKIIDYYRAQDRGTKYVFPILLQDKMTFSQ